MNNINNKILMGIYHLDPRWCSHRDFDYVTRQLGIVNTVRISNEGVASVGSVGLIMGSDGCFRPDDKITREELSTIIARMIDSEEKEYSLDNLEFSDKENISDWAVKGITVCYENAIVKGMENGEFMPKNPTTRAQAAVIISKVLQLKGGAENE